MTVRAVVADGCRSRSAYPTASQQCHLCRNWRCRRGVGDEAGGRIAGAVHLGDVGEHRVVRAEEGEVARLEVILPDPCKVALCIVGDVTPVVIVGINSVHPPDVGGGRGPILAHQRINSPSARRVSTRSASTGIAAMLSRAPSPRKAPFSRVGVSRNCSLRADGQQVFHQIPHSVGAWALDEVKDERESSMRLCRSTNLKFAVVTAIGALEISK